MTGRNFPPNPPATACSDDIIESGPCSRDCPVSRYADSGFTFFWSGNTAPYQVCVIAALNAERDLRLAITNS